MRPVLPLVSLLALLAACAPSAPSPSAPPDAGPASASSSNGQFTLSLRVEDAVVGTEEPIVAVATLTNEAGEAATLSGSGSGVVFFSVTRREDGLGSGPPAWTDDCVRHVVPAGTGVEVPFAKSGGWAPDDPNAAFLRTYFADPALHLPPGTWRIEATTSATVGEGCTGEALDLRTEVDVVVRDG